MNANVTWTFRKVLLAALLGFAAASALAEDMKEKAPLYSYQANWVLPRANWPEMEKVQSDPKRLEKILASSGITGAGADATVLHREDEATQDAWFSGKSLSSLLRVLEQIGQAGQTPPVFAQATKHWDGFYESRYYNWRAGTYSNAYTRAWNFTLRADAPDDAMGMVIKHFYGPLLEKLLTEGAIVEYEFDVEAVHANDPNQFYLVVYATNAEGLDKLDAAIDEAGKQIPLVGPMLDRFIDWSKHRDSLLRSVATFK